MIERLNLRFVYIVARNFLVWRKLMGPSLIGNLADPLIYLIGLGYGIGNFLPKMSNLPYITFLSAGMICYSAMNSATYESLYSAFSRLKIQRTWEGILHAPMTITDVVLGEWVWSALKSTLSGGAMLLVMYLLHIVHGIAPLAVLPVVLLVGLAFAGMGLVMTALARSYDFFVYYFTLVITPMMFLSGVFFPRSALPAPIQSLVQLLPLPHGTALARALTLGIPTPHPWIDVGALAAYALAFIIVAIALIQRRLMK